MDKSPHKNKAESPGGVLPPGDVAAVPVWIVSEDNALTGQLLTTLNSLTSNVSHFEPDKLDEVTLKRVRETPPMLIILDVAHDMDRGLHVIQRLKRHRITAPLIVVTQDISREFGAKIISQGVRYYFSRDFNSRELLEVADSYLKVGLPARMEEG